MALQTVTIRIPSGPGYRYYDRWAEALAALGAVMTVRQVDVAGGDELAAYQITAVSADDDGATITGRLLQEGFVTVPAAGGGSGDIHVGQHATSACRECGEYADASYRLRSGRA